MQGYQNELRELLGKVLTDPDANSEQKILARRLLDRLPPVVSTADTTDPPEGSGNAVEN